MDKIGVVVLGHTGYIGESIAHCLKTKYKVHGLSRGNGYDLLSKDGQERLVRLLSCSCSTLINACSLVPSSSGRKDCKELQELNTELDQNIAEIVRETGKDYIYLSGTSLYRERSKIINEEDDIECKGSHYLMGKYYGEGIARLLKKTSVIRIPSPICIRVNHRTVIGKMLSNAKNKGFVEYWGDGSRSQNFIDYKDISNMIERIIRYKAHGIYNCTNDRSWTMREVASLVCDVVGNGTKTVCIDKEGENDMMRQIFSNEKAATVLGWRPMVELRESLQRLLEWTRF